MIDPRLTPARGDVAAAHLRGQVEAKRFVEGTAYQMQDGVSALRETPSLSARLETQVLRGEIFTVYDVQDDWAFGQCALDDYVGYIEVEALRSKIIAPTHRVGALRTIVFPEPSLKAQPHFYLSCNAKVSVTTVREGFAEIEDGWCPAHHLVTLDHRVADWVASAERMIGVPYLWGGKDSFGVDCSGLMQAALETACIACPRDSDMQEAALGEAIEPDLRQLTRGDLVFWDGHVGIMRDRAHVLHANGVHMETVVEALEQTIARAGAPRSVRRL